jgi:hypothetical protein
LRYTNHDSSVILRDVGIALATTVLMVSCTSPHTEKTALKNSPSAQTTTELEVLTEVRNPVMGETLYVPIYSHIYYAEDRQLKLNLTATLSIRNTDLQQSLVINSVRYYNSDGRQVRRYLEKPVRLNAMATKDFVVPSTDTLGGAGANFIVEWVAKQKNSEPLVEAVMIGTEGNRGFSFVSPARVTKRLTPPPSN